MTKSAPPIPEAALNQHIAILGKTGSGKTYTAKGIVEHLLREKRQVCVVDPTGAWWGLRLGADGKSKGFDVVLIGGKHADIPLSDRSGAAVARLVTEQGASVVLDTTGLSVAEYTRWFIDFAGTIYTTIQDPLHLVIDEAHYFMPQGRVPDPEAGKMLHAGNRLMSGGRSLGIRGLMVTQRPAKLHKDSLTCADTLIAMRLIAPQDRKAVEEWIEGQGDPVKGKEVLTSLAQLKRGQGWAWYPEGDYLERVTFPKISTYDSSATPTHGAKAGPAVGEIKLDEVKAALANAVKEAEANDPKLLRKRVAELEKSLKANAPAASDPAAVDRAVARAQADRDAFWKRELDVIRRRQTSLAKLPSLLRDAAATIESFKIDAAAVPATPALNQNGHARPQTKLATPARAPSTRTSPRPAVVNSDSGLTRPELALLSACKWYELLGIQEPTSDQLCYKLGYSPTSSTMSVLLSKLRKGGYLDGSRLTDLGAAQVPDVEMGTLEEFHTSIREFLDGSARKLFDLLLSAHPTELEAEQICEQVDPPWSTTSSTLSVAASSLRRAGLMTKRGYTLTETVFPTALA